MIVNIFHKIFEQFFNNKKSFDFFFFSIISLTVGSHTNCEAT